MKKRYWKTISSQQCLQRSGMRLEVTWKRNTAETKLGWCAAGWSLGAIGGRPLSGGEFTPSKVS